MLLNTFTGTKAWVSGRTIEPSDCRYRTNVNYGERFTVFIVPRVCVAFEYREDVHRVQKNCAKLFLPELRQISTNFDNFCHTDSTKDKFI